MNPNSQAGGNDSLVVWTELWGADPVISERMFIEMTIPPNLHGKSQRWIETYAGYTGVSTLLERLYNSGVREGHLIDLGIPGLEVYANPESKILALWNTSPRLPWQTKEYYQSEEAVLAPNEFLRVHRNQWVTATSEFVPEAWWVACNRELPSLDKYRQVAIGIDAAVSSDSFAVVAVSRHGDDVAVRECREWIPPKKGKISFTNFDDPNDPEYPEGFIKMLCEKYNVVVAAYDEYQLAMFAEKMLSENIAWFQPFPQGPRRAVADKKLHDLIRDRKLYHSGEEALTKHIMNADSTAEDSEKMRLVKRNQDMKIDLAVALSMACDKAYEYLSP
jgi:phage terminase large subunit-like protein